MSERDDRDRPPGQAETPPAPPPPAAPPAPPPPAADAAAPVPPAAAPAQPAPPAADTPAPPPPAADAPPPAPAAAAAPPPPSHGTPGASPGTALDDLDDEALAVLAEAGERVSGPEPRPVDDPEPPLPLDEVEVRDLLRAALRPPPGSVAPSLLGGVQRRLRQRSRGKFYGDGWSTAKAPRSTYLFTSLLMLAVIVLVYVVLVPFAGSALP